MSSFGGPLCSLGRSTQESGCCLRVVGGCSMPAQGWCCRPAFWLVLTNGGEAALRVLDAVSALLALAYTTDRVWGCPPASEAVRTASANAIKFIEAFKVVSHVFTSVVSICTKLWLVKCCRNGRRKWLSCCFPYKTASTDDAAAHAKMDAAVQQRIKLLTAEAAKARAHARGCRAAVASLFCGMCRRAPPTTAVDSPSAQSSGRYNRLSGGHGLASPHAHAAPPRHGVQPPAGLRKAEVSLSPRGRSAVP